MMAEAEFYRSMFEEAQEFLYCLEELEGVLQESNLVIFGPLHWKQVVEMCFLVKEAVAKLASYSLVKEAATKLASCFLVKEAAVKREDLIFLAEKNFCQAKEEGL